MALRKVIESDLSQVGKLSGLPLPPRVAYTYEYNVTATSVRTATPDAWRGKIVTFRARTNDVFILFGDATVTADDSAVAGATGCCQVIPVEQSTDWYVSPTADCDYFAVKAASGNTAKLRSHVSSF